MGVSLVGVSEYLTPVMGSQREGRKDKGNRDQAGRVREHLHQEGESGRHQVWRQSGGGCSGFKSAGDVDGGRLVELQHHLVWKQ
ncbi:hypothetical protein E2C01_088013 [Portunus trituberculatus]|uniref:Uncharacterized protein n=1 Tax=Portunus trituberculatus TaxID=210409 RepID=A0A5B7J828_PORTR|nr:hypothetical protein [Portunus trituberculatus]